ncbi:hypothetical protein NESM_000255700 [Novymonas esmeraldas]|uniref:Uncharacterized protein n=1 Tax=Novymonas esmeraldas TaxID=1808958 RepID=A0AAW0F6I1_9TRYP
MGALPSRESNEDPSSVFFANCGSHIVFHVPLTQHYFASPASLAFQQLHHARNNQSALYCFDVTDVSSVMPAAAAEAFRAAQQEDWGAEVDEVDPSLHYYDDEVRERVLECGGGGGGGGDAARASTTTTTTTAPSESYRCHGHRRCRPSIEDRDELYRVLITEPTAGTLVDTDEEMCEWVAQEQRWRSALAATAAPCPGKDDASNHSPAALTPPAVPPPPPEKLLYPIAQAIALRMTTEEEEEMRADYCRRHNIPYVAVAFHDVRPTAAGGAASTHPKQQQQQQQQQQAAAVSEGVTRAPPLPVVERRHYHFEDDPKYRDGRVHLVEEHGVLYHFAYFCRRSRHRRDDDAVATPASPSTSSPASTTATTATAAAALDTTASGATPISDTPIVLGRCLHDVVYCEEPPTAIRHAAAAGGGDAEVAPPVRYGWCARCGERVTQRMDYTQLRRLTSTRVHRRAARARRDGGGDGSDDGGHAVHCAAEDGEDAAWNTERVDEDGEDEFIINIAPVRVVGMNGVLPSRSRGTPWLRGCGHADDAAAAAVDAVMEQLPRPPPIMRVCRFIEGSVGDKIVNRSALVMLLSYRPMCRQAGLQDALTRPIWSTCVLSNIPYLQMVRETFFRAKAAVAEVDDKDVRLRDWLGVVDRDNNFFNFINANLHMMRNFTPPERTVRQRELTEEVASTGTATSAASAVAAAVAAVKGSGGAGAGGGGGSVTESSSPGLAVSLASGDDGSGDGHDGVRAALLVAAADANGTTHHCNAKDKDAARVSTTTTATRGDRSVMVDGDAPELRSRRLLRPLEEATIGRPEGHGPRDPVEDDDDVDAARARRRRKKDKRQTLPCAATTAATAAAAVVSADDGSDDGGGGGDDDVAARRQRRECGDTAGRAGGEEEKDDPDWRMEEEGRGRVSGGGAARPRTVSPPRMATSGAMPPPTVAAAHGRRSDSGSGSVKSAEPHRPGVPPRPNFDLFSTLLEPPASLSLETIFHHDVGSPDVAATPASSSHAPHDALRENGSWSAARRPSHALYECGMLATTRGRNFLFLLREDCVRALLYYCSAAAAPIFIGAYVEPVDTTSVSYGGAVRLRRPSSVNLALQTAKGGGSVGTAHGGDTDAVAASVEAAAAAAAAGAVAPRNYDGERVVIGQVEEMAVMAEYLTSEDLITCFSVSDVEMAAPGPSAAHRLHKMSLHQPTTASSSSPSVSGAVTRKDIPGSAESGAGALVAQQARERAQLGHVFTYAADEFCDGDLVVYNFDQRQWEHYEHVQLRRRLAAKAAAAATGGGGRGGRGSGGASHTPEPPPALDVAAAMGSSSRASCGGADSSSTGDRESSVTVASTSTRLLCVGLDELLLSWTKWVVDNRFYEDRRDPGWLSLPDGSPIQLSGGRYYLWSFRHNHQRYFYGVIPKFAKGRLRRQKLLERTRSKKKKKMEEEEEEAVEGVRRPASSSTSSSQQQQQQRQQRRQSAAVATGDDSKSDSSPSSPTSRTASSGAAGAAAATVATTRSIPLSRLRSGHQARAGDPVPCQQGDEDGGSSSGGGRRHADPALRSVSATVPTAAAPGAGDVQPAPEPQRTHWTTNHSLSPAQPRQPLCTPSDSRRSAAVSAAAPVTHGDAAAQQHSRHLSAPRVGSISSGSGGGTATAAAATRPTLSAAATAGAGAVPAAVHHSPPAHTPPLQHPCPLPSSGSNSSSSHGGGGVVAGVARHQSGALGSPASRVPAHANNNNNSGGGARPNYYHQHGGNTFIQDGKRHENEYYPPLPTRTPFRPVTIVADLVPLPHPQSTRGGIPAMFRYWGPVGLPAPRVRAPAAAASSTAWPPSAPPPHAAPSLRLPSVDLSTVPAIIPVTASTAAGVVAGGGGSVRGVGPGSPTTAAASLNVRVRRRTASGSTTSIVPVQGMPPHGAHLAGAPHLLMTAGVGVGFGSAALTPSPHASCVFPATPIFGDLTPGPTGLALQPHQLMTADDAVHRLSPTSMLPTNLINEGSKTKGESVLRVDDDTYRQREAFRWNPYASTKWMQSSATASHNSNSNSSTGGTGNT